MGVNNSYTDSQILRGLKTHVVNKMLSKYTLYKPMTWQGVLKRMEKSPDFAAKVNTITAEADALWDAMGIKALTERDEAFNVPLFKMYAGSKKSFQTFEVLELTAKVEALEAALAKSQK